MARVRKDVWKLGAGWNDTLLWYAKAVRALQSRPFADRTSWLFLAAIHGFHPVVWRQFGAIQAGTPLPPLADQTTFWDQCQHQSWYFLPWHRAYLAALEAIVLDAVVAAGGPADWALPYWNYSDPTQPDARTLPSAFALATLPDGSANPLRVARRFGTGTSPIRVPSSYVSLDALGHDVFAGGDSDVPPGFGGPQTVFHHGPESQTTNGGLESVPHNLVHGGIGGVAPGTDPNDWWNAGLMSIPISAALDPIFWLHHANIDRLWSVWLADTAERHDNPDDVAWLDGPVDRRFVMPAPDSSERTWTAREVLDTTAPLLDYTYEDATTTPEAPRMVRRLQRLGARAGARGAREDGAAVAHRELIGASEAPVQVRGATETSVRLDPVATRPLRQLARAAATEPAASAEPPRVFLKLEGIKGTSDAAIYHVYVDLPADADPADARYDDRRAGTVSLFGVSAASDADGPTSGSGLNQVLEITEIVDALHLSGEALERLDVRFVPAHAAVADARFSIDRLSVFRLG